MNFGDFVIFPKCLKLWVFSRLHPFELDHLRVNKTLRDYINNEVKPYIINSVEAYIKERKYVIYKDKINCKCSSINLEGCAVNHLKNVIPYHETRGDIRDKRYKQLSDKNDTVSDEGVYTYSFALYPEEHQPSGHVNISSTFDYRDFSVKGICFNCVLIHGLPKVKDPVSL